MTDIPLSAIRLPQNKVVGNCRDFSVLMSSLLRHKGIPARVRVGYGTDLEPDVYTYHFICQYWNNDEKRWIWVDAMIDDIFRKVYNISFDTYDMPEGLFLPAGDCWQMCRTGKVDPNLFWYFQDLRGIPFVLGNIVRDLASLNKVEVLAWDKMDIMPDNESKEIPQEDMDLIDSIALVIKGENPDFIQLRSVYENDDRLHLPDFVENYNNRI